MYLTEPKPSSLLDGRLTRKDYLQINVLPDLVMVVEREGNSHVLQRKAIGRATSKVVRETSISASTKFAQVADVADSLNVTLDDLVGIRKWILINGWM